MWLELQCGSMAVWHMANYGMSYYMYKKNTELEVLPVADLLKESAKKTFFCGRCNTGVLAGTSARYQLNTQSRHSLCMIPGIHIHSSSTSVIPGIDIYSSTAVVQVIAAKRVRTPPVFMNQ